MQDVKLREEFATGPGLMGEVKPRHYGRDRVSTGRVWEEPRGAYQVGSVCGVDLDDGRDSRVEGEETVRVVRMVLFRSELVLVGGVRDGSGDEAGEGDDGREDGGGEHVLQAGCGGLGLVAVDGSSIWNRHTVNVAKLYIFHS